MNDPQPIIQVKNLRKNYGSVTAVDDISFEVYHGEIFGVIGPNGAGKTTSLECLTGLRKPDSGSLNVLGLDPQRQPAQLRRVIGVQLQEAALPEDIKVWEALDLFASFYDHTTDWNALLEPWGLAEKRNARFGSLSGGQKQRLFIALALVNDPEIVFLDEISTGLDPQARRNTWELVEKLRRHGKTVVMVTHDMDEAQQLCDRVALIDHGRLVALDTPGMLIQRIQAEIRVTFNANGRESYDWLAGIPGVRQVERQNGSISVAGEGVLLARVASALAARGIVPDDLHTQRATLEDVFIALTGKTIRD